MSRWGSRNSSSRRENFSNFSRNQNSTFGHRNNDQWRMLNQATSSYDRRNRWRNEYESYGMDYGNNWNDTNSSQNQAHSSSRSENYDYHDSWNNRGYQNSNRKFYTGNDVDRGCHRQNEQRVTNNKSDYHDANMRNEPEDYRENHRTFDNPRHTGNEVDRGCHRRNEQRVTNNRSDYQDAYMHNEPEDYREDHRTFDDPRQRYSNFDQRQNQWESSSTTSSRHSMQHYDDRNTRQEFRNDPHEEVYRDRNHNNYPRDELDQVNSRVDGEEFHRRYNQESRRGSSEDTNKPSTSNSTRVLQPKPEKREIVSRLGLDEAASVCSEKPEKSFVISLEMLNRDLKLDKLREAMLDESKEPLYYPGIYPMGPPSREWMFREIPDLAPLYHEEQHEERFIKRIIVKEDMVRKNLRRPCLFCNDRHYTDECPKCTDVGERKDLLLASGRCLRCLGRHSTINCRRNETECCYCDDADEKNLHHCSICPFVENLVCQ